MIAQPQTRQRTLSAALSAGENPYVGPRTFTRHEANRFFGREREARELRSLVIAERLVLFYAQSGAGKSSLLNTRLIPELKESNFLVLPVGRVGGELPAGVGAVDNIYVFNLLLSLDQGQDGAGAGGNGGSDPRRFAGMTLVEFMRGLRTPDGEYYYYDAALAQSAAQTPVEEFHGQPPHVLIIDQFEELITNHPARWREREAFFRQLDAAMRADPLLWVVLTLREDFVPALDPYARLVAGGMRARFYMQRMGVDAALQAVRYPAEDAGRPFAEGVAETLVDNLRQIRMQGQVEPQPGQFVEPVQLQVVCYQLWEHVKDRPPGPITAADLDAAGDVDSALADFYESAIAAVLSDPKLELSEHQLRNWFDTQLITEAGTRGIVYQGEEQTAGMPNNVVRRLQNQFLLRAELRAGGTWIELIHDRFVGPIQQANRRRQSPLAQDAAAWRAAGKPKARLYTGYQLAQAQQPVEENPQSFTALEREFVEAAINAEEARKRRNRNLITAGSLLLVLLLGAAAIWAFLSRLEAVKANQDLALVNEELVAARTTEAELRQISDQATAAAVATSQEVALVARATYDAAVGEAIAFAQQQQELNVIRRTAEAMQSEATVVAGDLAFVLAALAPTPAVTPRGTRETILWIIASRLTPSPTVDANLLITVEAIQTRVSQSSAPTPTATLPPPTPLPTPPPLLPSITGTALALTPEPIPTETATPSPTAPASQLIGIVPAIPLSVFAQPDVNATVVARVNAGAEVSVLGFGTQNWVQVRTSAGSEGWMRGQFLTYRGDVSTLPTDLAYRSIEDRTDLPFIEGEVAVSDWLLANPNAEETSGFRWIPAGTNVLVLLSGRGSTSYGSGVWYLVSLVDPENSASIIQGWLAAEVVDPRGEPQVPQQQLVPTEPAPSQQLNEPEPQTNSASTLDTSGCNAGQQIIAPQDGQELERGYIAIYGEAGGVTTSYSLSYAFSSPTGESQTSTSIVFVDVSAPKPSGVLAVWDTKELSPGFYDLTLTTNDSLAQSRFCTIRVELSDSLSSNLDLASSGLTIPGPDPVAPANGAVLSANTNEIELVWTDVQQTENLLFEVIVFRIANGIRTDIVHEWYLPVPFIAIPIETFQERGEYRWQVRYVKVDATTNLRGSWGPERNFTIQ